MLAKFPREDDLERPTLHVNPLAELNRLYGRRRESRPVFEPTKADLDDYGEFDIIQFAGGSLEKSEHTAHRRTLIEGDRGCIRKRKSECSDSSDDDANKKGVDITFIINDDYYYFYFY